MLGTDYVLFEETAYNHEERCFQHAMAEDLQWFYSYFNPSTVRNIPPQYFVMISKTGSLDLGDFPFPEWHKQEKENILSNVGIKVEHGKPALESEYKGTFRTVGNKEHADIVRLYIEEELVFNKIAEVLGRSSRILFYANPVT